jgi:hypothetical protein
MILPSIELYVLKCVYRFQINLAFIISASGIFPGAIDVGAENGELLFPNVLLSHAGDHILTVFTNTHNMGVTATFKLIVFGEFIIFSKEIP